MTLRRQWETFLVIVAGSDRAAPGNPGKKFSDISEEELDLNAF